MREDLTALERQVYHYLVEYLGEHTYQPSIREIAARFKIRSTKTVAELLRSLQNKGYIERQGSRSRGIHLIGMEGPIRSVPVPYYLRISNAPPVLSEEQRGGFITCDHRFVPHDDVFFVRADSAMADGAPGVFTGDFLLIDPIAPAGDRTTVLARVGNDILVRTIAHRGAATVLVPATPDLPELALGAGSDFQVIGVMCALLRAEQVAGI